MFDKLRRWLSLADFSQAKDQAFRAIASRYSRGNVPVQDGRYMTDEDLDALRIEGDRACARLRALRTAS